MEMQLHQDQETLTKNMLEAEVKTLKFVLKFLYR